MKINKNLFHNKRGVFQNTGLTTGIRAESFKIR